MFSRKMLSNGIIYGVVVLSLIAVANLYYQHGNSDTNLSDLRSNRRLSSSPSDHPLGVVGKHSKEVDAPTVMFLMAFPESGEKYTIDMLEKASGFGTATNYGNIFLKSATGEHALDTYQSAPVFTDRHNGPFLFSDRKIPSKFIVTKTHCGGHCTDCEVNDFVVGTSEFFMRCGQAQSFLPNSDGGKLIYTQYSPRMAERVIHLVRNPFDNIASRFQHEYQRHTDASDFEFTAAFSYNREGFQRWCRYLANQVDPDEIAFKHISSGRKIENNNNFFRSAQENVPCFTEFYKYVQWHNHASRILDNYNGHHDNVDVLTLHYEDYLHNFNGAVNTVLKFSKLPRVNEINGLFFERYDYYTREDKDKIIDFIKTLANESANPILEIYYRS